MHESFEHIHDRFFATYPIYQRFQSVDTFKEMHQWMWQPESIAKMLDATKFTRPAIEGIVLDIEETFGVQNDLDFGDDFTKKATGMLIKYVLEHFGYISLKQKDIGRGKGAKYFTSGMYYTFVPEKESLRLVTELSIVELNKEGE